MAQNHPANDTFSGEHFFMLY